MTKLNVFLMFLLTLCALGVVSSQDQARKVFVELEKAQYDARQIDTRWDQLEVAQSSLAKSSLIDEKARRSLSMQPVSNERTLHLNLTGDATRASASVGPGSAGTAAAAGRRPVDASGGGAPTMSAANTSTAREGRAHVEHPTTIASIRRN